MSAAPNSPRQAAGPKLRWWHFLLTALLVLLSLPVFAALALAFRLWAGPIDVTDSARRLLVRDGVHGLSLGSVQLAWNGWREGPSAPLGVRVDDVSFGEARIEHGFAALDLVALMHGHATIRALQASNGSVSLVRAADGTIALAGGEPPQKTRRLQAGAAGANGAKPGPLDLSELQQLDIGHGVIKLSDAASGLSCRAELGDVSLNPLRRPAAIGVTGHIDATVSCGGAILHVRGAGREGPEGGIAWHIESDPFVPASYAHLVPALAPLGAAELPVSMSIDTVLSGGFGRTMLPRRLDLRARLGAGLIRIGGPARIEGAGKPEGLPVRGGSLHLLLSLPERPEEPVRAVLSESSLVLAEADASPVLRLDASLSSRHAALQGDVAAQIDRFDFAGLAAIWPEGVAGGARKWITANITAGSGRDVSVTAGLVSSQGVDGLSLTSLSGGLDASDLTVNWLRPIEPLRGVDAHLVLEGPDALRIESRNATESVAGPGRAPSTIAAGPTVMRITGLSQKDQYSQIDTRLRGGLGSVLALLAQPRLRLLSKHPLDFKNPSGAVDIRLALQIPLLDRVTADDLGIHADANLKHVHLGDAVAGRDLDNADLKLAVTSDGLKLQGQGALAALPVKLSYAMDFRSGGPHQVTDTAHVTTHIDGDAIRREGFDPGGGFGGTADVTLDYANHRDGVARVAAALDLTDAALRTPVWRKQRGAATEASGTVEFLKQHLSAITALHASGPDLLLDAHGEISLARLHALVIDRFAVGRSQGAGRIEVPGAASKAPIRVALHGPVLDIAPLFASAPSESGPSESAPSADAGNADQNKAARGTSQQLWRGDFAFKRVLFDPTRSFTGVTLHAEARGVQVSNASLAIDGPTSLTATLTPEQEAGDARMPDRRLVLHAADAGALLAALGFGNRIEGGVLNLEGSLVDLPASMRLTALAKVGAFLINDAPLAARLARDFSGYGFLTGGSHRQLEVSRLEIPFVLDGDTLQLNGAHAASAALGATLRGPVDLRQETLDLHGTVVPSYVLNALPGKLPGLGRVFSPEKGGGLLAATLRITGPLDKPAVSVNPLALLAPGILRRLLFN